MRRAAGLPAVHAAFLCQYAPVPGLGSDCLERPLSAQTPSGPLTVVCRFLGRVSLPVPQSAMLPGVREAPMHEIA